MEGTANEEVPHNVQHRPIASHRNENDDVTPGEVKNVEENLVANKIGTMVGEALDEAVHISLYNARSGVRSVAYNVVEQMMLYLLRKNVIGKTLYAHIVKNFDIYAAD